MRGAYSASGLRINTEKSIHRQFLASFWGARVDGLSGDVRAPIERGLALAGLTLAVARLGFSSVNLLTVLAGSWVAIFAFNRRLMCILELIFEAQRGRRQEDVLRLSQRLRAELWSLALVLPFAAYSARTPASSELWGVDASSWGIAAVKTSLNPVRCEELDRYTARAGKWTRLLGRAASWLRTHGALEPEHELPAGQTFEGSEVWATLFRSCRFRLSAARRNRRRVHINLGEIRSWKLAGSEAPTHPSTRLTLCPVPGHCSQTFAAPSLPVWGPPRPQRQRLSAPSSASFLAAPPAGVSFPAAYRLLEQLLRG